MIVAGDIGGTSTRLVLVGSTEQAGDPRKPARKAHYRSTDADLATLVERFLDEGGARARIDAAAFGVPGPVRGARADVPKLGWQLDARDLERRLGIRTVALCNDLVATGLGLRWLAADRFAVLNRGVTDPDGNGAIVAAGTGLGEAILLREPGGFRPLASEGGHADFAPHDAEQDELLRFLRGRHADVPVERVVSGPGLVNVFEWLCATTGPPAAEVTRRLRSEDPAHVISTAALAGDCASCERALGVFVDAYAAEAANLALKALATGGVFLAGGIAPKILPALQSERFLHAFRGTGPLAGLLARIPISVVLDDEAALLGAAGLALSIA